MVTLTCAIVGVVGLMPHTATAQTSPPSIVAPAIELDATEADIRTAWIQSRLDAESAAAQRWYWISLGLLSAGVAGQVAAGLAVSDTGANGQLLAPMDRLKPSLFVGASTAMIGVLGRVVLPFHPAFAAAELRRMPARTPQERIARTRRAEAILDDCASGEDFGRSWLIHAAGLVVAGGSSLILWLGYQQGPLTVIGNFALTIGFHELQVLTQPAQLIQDRTTYHRDNWRPLAFAPPRRPPGIQVMPVPFPGGAGLIVVF